MSEVVERALEWDDYVENDGGDFVLLEPGVYNFTVMKFERGRHNGSEKLPACNKAILTIEVDGGEQGKATVKENLFLHSKTEGLLCQFFRSIGQRQSGEKLKMDWGKVPGSTGRGEFYTRTYRKNDGTEGASTDLKRWLDPENTEPASYQEGQF